MERWAKFSLFQSHLDFAHNLWSHLLQEGDVAVDATCGNGHDTLFLAQLCKGKVFAFDIQASAIEKTRSLLETHLDGDQMRDVVLEQRSHEVFPDALKLFPPKLFVYNLGYLPGGDKALTTQSQTTLNSLSEACKFLAAGGVISVTCYPGHAEGAHEEQILKEWCQTLVPLEWSCSWMRWLNRKNAPSLMLIQKKISYTIRGYDG